MTDRRDGLRGCDEPLSHAYGLALVDLDGVVYRGGQAVEHAVDSLRRVIAEGMAVEYTTNNSSRRPRVVADQLRGFGLELDDEDVITSSIVASRMVARRLPAGARVLVLGADHLREQVAQRGLVPVDSADDAPQAVIQGWYPDISWRELAQASFAVERGARYFVTNLDLTIPREKGIAPGCGSLIRAVIGATGVKPEGSAGKPEAAMYDEARLLAAHDGRTPVARERCLAVGDRLDTDIEAGVRGGYDSLLVLTGVTDRSGLLRAPRGLRPTYVGVDLRALVEPQPVPRLTAEGDGVCGGARARRRGTGIEASGGCATDRLRAACVLAWSLTDDGVHPEDLVLPDATCFEDAGEAS
ncbi:HAD-IIA family hydrolase [uncultured Bifidobacterium sp.]|uniref:HAD-IIA family hydrolase n=1 Tax=uncultured Bifidobacterium sp. TaxID=165187 RepID=UPI0028DB2C88|nr:HAD-IIA family hydrolase [uncultured Bifidobacterium sp.]